LIENKPAGIIAYMDEEISLANGTEQGFLEKITKTFQNHTNFQSSISGKKGASKFPNNSFILKHYAGEVLYSCDNILEKNKDQLYKLHQEVMSTSKNRAIRIMFPPIDTKSTKRPPSAGTQFKKQVNELMDTLMGCEPHYIRTIKSNDKKMGGVFDDTLVTHQSRYLGLLENIQVRRAGFCYRKEFDFFLKRYKMLSKETWPKPKQAPKEACKALMTSLGFTNADFQVGNTKVFIKHPRTVFALEDRREEKLPVLVTRIQACYRGFNVRTNLAKFKAALLIQKIVRKFLRKLQLKRMSEKEKAMFVNQQLAARVFDNRKQGYKDNREWKSLYVQIPPVALQKIFAKFGDNKVIFASTMNRINSANQIAPRTLVLTEKSLYYLDPQNHGFKHRIDLKTLQAVIVSSRPDKYFILKDGDPRNYDWIFESEYRTEFIITLYRVYRGVHGKPVPVEVSNKVEMRVKPKKKRLIQFEVGQPGMTAVNKTTISISSPKSNELINQQVVYLGPKTTTEVHVVKAKEKRFKVLFEYQPMERDELELRVNDIILVKPTDRSDGGWSVGTNTRTNLLGVFPLNYTELQP